MDSIITLENVENFSTKLSEHQLKWMFEDLKTRKIRTEVENQIIPLQREAAKFLIDFRSTQKHLNDELFKETSYFKKEDAFISKGKPKETIQKWLSEREIPLDRKVFWVNSLNVAFVMTWKMVIQFSDILFFGTNEILWDKTTNWVLSFESNEVFHFVDNLMFNSEKREKEAIALDELITKAWQNRELQETEEMVIEGNRAMDIEVMSEGSKIQYDEYNQSRKQPSQR